jgi:hypothetical protein
MAIATAPTEAEIREAVRQQWDQWNVEPWNRQPLSSRLEDLVGFDLFCGVGSVLYDRSREDGMEGPLDKIERVIMGPIVAECDRLILEGMAAAFERFAREYPKARRAKHARAA